MKKQLKPATASLAILIVVALAAGVYAYLFRLRDAPLDPADAGMPPEVAAEFQRRMQEGGPLSTD